MPAKLTPAQFDLAMLANRASLAGLGNVANAAAEALRRQIRPDLVAFPLPRPAERPKRKFYGRFKLTEMDECSLETIETPKWAKEAFPRDFIGGAQ